MCSASPRWCGSPGGESPDVMVSLDQVLATAPPVLFALIANILLLTLRASAGSLGFIHSRRLFHLLDALIVLVFVVFIVLVVVRFKTLD